MDVAYDHIQEEILSPDEAAKKAASEKQKESNLNTEFQEAYRSFSASPWGAKLGGFFSDVKRQGETYYEGARQEATAASGEALHRSEVHHCQSSTVYVYGSISACFACGRYI